MVGVLAAGVVAVTASAALPWTLVEPAGGATVGETVAPASGRTAARGLWPSTFTAGLSAAACGRWRLDEDGFCVADDARNGLEVGTRFRTAAPVWVTGVRIYRVDPGRLRASLWQGDGTLLAQGRLADRDRSGWQDLSFATPVRTEPGITYVASYFTPATRYAFAYGYFTQSGRTVGAVTALRAGDDGPNGVHCYDDAACGSFPVRGHRDSTYWVTPLWVPADGGTTTPPGQPPSGDPGADTTAPRVTTTAPADGAGRVAPGATVRASFSEPLRRATVQRATVRLVHHRTGAAVTVGLRYDAGRARVVLEPRSPLRRGTTYRVHVTSGVRDLAGNRLDQDRAQAGNQPATWRFRTRR